MRDRFITASNLVLIIVVLILNGCGYFENDGIKSETRIVGNIYLHEYGNTEAISLVFDEGDGMYAIIVPDCHSVYYDSTESRIYVEELITESSSLYYSFILKDPSSRTVWQALEKHEVHEATFKKRIAKNSSVLIELNSQID